MNKSLQIITNYFKVNINTTIHKYDLVLDDGVVNEQMAEVNEVMFKNKENRDMLHGKFGNNFLFLSNSIYSLQMVPEQMEFVLSNGNTLRICYDASAKVKDETKNNIIGRLLKILQKKLRYKLVGRKLFNTKDGVTVREFEIWPGYQTAFLSLQHQAQPLNVLNIDLVHKVITNSNVLERMNELKQKFYNNYEYMIQQEFVGKSIMTNYNRKIYRIDRIEFNKTPVDSFTNQKGEEIRFIDYYQNQYKLSIENNQQPLIVHLDEKKNETVNEIFLIPELCVMTGLNDQQRGDFNLMKDLDVTLQPDPYLRITKCQQLVEQFKKNVYTKSILDEWELQIDEYPMEVTGEKIHPGNLLFHQKKVPLQENQNLLRDAQG